MSVYYLPRPVSDVDLEARFDERVVGFDIHRAFVHRSAPDLSFRVGSGGIRADLNATWDIDIRNGAS